MTMMNMAKMNACILALALAAIAEDGSEDRIQRSPLEIGTDIDVGQIVKGTAGDENPVKNVDGQMIQRTSVFFNQTTTIDRSLTIKVGVGGLFFYGFPEKKNQAGSRSVRFGPGVGQAQAIYSLGDPAAPEWLLQFGYFPYKYNPDAKNLGEFLLRSGTYPGYEVTGGWSILNSAAYMASGLRVHGNFLGNALGADLNLFLEHDLEPLYDLSPSILLTYRPGAFFEAGAGAEFAHLIPVNPSKDKSVGTAFLGDSLADPAEPGAQKFTFQGVKLMARASLDFGSLINSPAIGPNGFKLYSEVAVLGVKNYPYYYADITRRIPVLMGIDLPSFGLLDVLSAEAEYRKWDFPNNTYEVLESVEPIWHIPDQYQSDWHQYDPKTQADKSGDWKWTVYAKKRLMSRMSLYMQAASDHMRGILWDELVLGRTTITQRPSQWYYVFRLEFGV